MRRSHRALIRTVKYNLIFMMLLGLGDGLISPARHLAIQFRRAFQTCSDARVARDAHLKGIANDRILDASRSRGSRSALALVFQLEPLKAG